MKYLGKICEFVFQSYLKGVFIFIIAIIVLGNFKVDLDFSGGYYQIHTQIAVLVVGMMSNLLKYKVTSH